MSIKSLFQTSRYFFIGMVILILATHAYAENSQCLDEFATRGKIELRDAQFRAMSVEELPQQAEFFEKDYPKGSSRRDLAHVFKGTLEGVLIAHDLFYSAIFKAAIGEAITEMARADFEKGLANERITENEDGDAKKFRYFSETRAAVKSIRSLKLPEQQALADQVYLNLRRFSNTETYFKPNSATRQLFAALNNNPQLQAEAKALIKNYLSLYSIAEVHLDPADYVDIVNEIGKKYSIQGLAALSCVGLVACYTGLDIHLVGGLPSVFYWLSKAFIARSSRYQREGIGLEQQLMLKDYYRSRSAMKEAPLAQDAVKRVEVLVASVRESNLAIKQNVGLLSSTNSRDFIENLFIYQGVLKQNLQEIKTAISNLRSLRDENTSYKYDVRESQTYDTELSKLIGELQTLEVSQERIIKGLSPLIQGAVDDSFNSLNRHHLSIIIFLNQMIK